MLEMFIIIGWIMAAFGATVIIGLLISIPLEMWQNYHRDKILSHWYWLNKLGLPDTANMIRGRQ